MSGPIRAYIKLRRHGARGPHFTVTMNKPDGLVLIDSTTEPLFDAARVLISKGITGRLEMWDSTRSFPRMQGDIERLAGMTVSEGKDGIALRKYAERVAGGDFEDEPPQDTRNEIGRPGSAVQGAGADLVDLDVDLGHPIPARPSGRSAVAA